MSDDVGEMMVYETRTKGAIFCRVIRIMQCAQGTPCIMGGNQKCTGAAPIFNRRAARIISLGLITNSQVAVALTRMIADPSA